MTADATVDPPVIYQRDTDGTGATVHNSSRFGICAYPVKFGGATRRTFIVNENNILYEKNTGGKPVLMWPSAEDLKSKWKKVEWGRGTHKPGIGSPLCFIRARRNALSDTGIDKPLRVQHSVAHARTSSRW